MGNAQTKIVDKLQSTDPREVSAGLKLFAKDAESMLLTYPPTYFPTVFALLNKYMQVENIVSAEGGKLRRAVIESLRSMGKMQQSVVNTRVFQTAARQYLLLPLLQSLFQATDDVQGQTVITLGILNNKGVFQSYGAYLSACVAYNTKEQSPVYSASENALRLVRGVLEQGRQLMDALSHDVEGGDAAVVLVARFLFLILRREANDGALGQILVEVNRCLGTADFLRAVGPEWLSGVGKWLVDGLHQHAAGDLLAPICDCVRTCIAVDQGAMLDTERLFVTLSQLTTEPSMSLKLKALEMIRYGLERIEIVASRHSLVVVLLRCIEPVRAQLLAFGAPPPEITLLVYREAMGCFERLLRLPKVAAWGGHYYKQIADMVASDIVCLRPEITGSLYSCLSLLLQAGKLPFVNDFCIKYMYVISKFAHPTNVNMILARQRLTGVDIVPTEETFILIPDPLPMATFETSFAFLRDFPPFKEEGPSDGMMFDSVSLKSPPPMITSTGGGAGAASDPTAGPPRTARASTVVATKEAPRASRTRTATGARIVDLLEASTTTTTTTTTSTGLPTVQPMPASVLGGGAGAAPAGPDLRASLLAATPDPVDHASMQHAVLKMIRNNMAEVMSVLLGADSKVHEYVLEIFEMVINAASQIVLCQIFMSAFRIVFMRTLRSEMRSHEDHTTSYQQEVTALREQLRMQQGMVHAMTAAHQELKSRLEVAMREKTNTESALTCAICLESFLGRRPVVTDTCGHVFCMECITAYVRTQPRATCPQCRTNIRLPLQELKGLNKD